MSSLAGDAAHIKCVVEAQLLQQQQLQMFLFSKRVVDNDGVVVADFLDSSSRDYTTLRGSGDLEILEERASINLL